MNTLVKEITIGSGKWVALIDDKPLQDFIGLRVFAGKTSAEAALADEIEQRSRDISGLYQTPPETIHADVQAKC